MSCPTTVTNLYVNDKSRCHIQWTNQSTETITRDVLYLAFRYENTTRLDLQAGVVTGVSVPAGQTVITTVESDIPVPPGWEVDTTTIPSQGKYYHVLAAIGRYDPATNTFEIECSLICENVIYVPP